MIDIARLLDQSNDRVAVLRPGSITGDGPVLLWVQRAQRASGNHAANVAIAIANRLKRPVIAAFCLAPAYPRATLRAYHFLAEGLTELPDGFAARGVGWTLRTGDPVDVFPALVRESGACAIVTDQAPTELATSWKVAVAQRVDVPVIAVDADVVVPASHFPKLEWAPRTIRPKVGRLLDRYLLPIPEPVAEHPSTFREAPDPFELVRSLNLDESVGPAPFLHGGQRAARARLRRFVESHLATYDVDRNRADIDGSSRMSPYLHYGQIAPVEIALTVMDALCGKGRENALQSFLNELIVQRELTINFALRQPGYDTYDGAIPDWGKATLAKHAADPRPHLYSASELEQGRTQDPLWNAAQLQMVHEGYMPNRLRMYWAKQVLLWTPSPEVAYQTVVTLNDRYFLDGRDAAGYAGIAWSIGGRHDRPFPPERPVAGLVRPMGANGMRKHMNVDGYIAGVQERYGPPRTARLF